MRLTVLGSAAAEGWPALFCACRACQRARELGGKNLRRRTSYRLDDYIHIDWGPDTYGACLALGLDTSRVTELLITHAHEDHLLVRDIFYRRPGFSQVPPEQTLTVRGSRQVIEAFGGVGLDLSRFRLAFDCLEPYRERRLSGGGAVIAVPASHAQEMGGALNFILKMGDRCLLIGNDTGWWGEEVWEFLSTLQLDVVVMDCTYGPRQERLGHLGVHEVVEAKQELLARGALAEGCRFIANHFSHNGGWLHADLERFLRPHGIEVGYDGMVVEI